MCVHAEHTRTHSRIYVEVYTHTHTEGGGWLGLGGENETMSVLKWESLILLFLMIHCDLQLTWAVIKVWMVHKSSGSLKQTGGKDWRSLKNKIYLSVSKCEVQAHPIMQPCPWTKISAARLAAAN